MLQLFFAKEEVRQYLLEGPMGPCCLPSLAVKLSKNGLLTQPGLTAAAYRGRSMPLVAATRSKSD